MVWYVYSRSSPIYVCSRGCPRGALRLHAADVDWRWKMHKNRELKIFTQTKNLFKHSTFYTSHCRETEKSRNSTHTLAFSMFFFCEHRIAHKCCNFLNFRNEMDLDSLGSCDSGPTVTNSFDSVESLLERVCQLLFVMVFFALTTLRKRPLQLIKGREMPRRRRPN